MREECKHFQSRTYNTGEVVRFCALDLAPEAPWRCPPDCGRYERRSADVGWVHTGLVDAPVEEEPGTPGPEMVQLLDEAEEIVNAVAPETLAEVEHDRSKRQDADRSRRRWPWRRRS